MSQVRAWFGTRKPIAVVRSHKANDYSGLVQAVGAGLMILGGVMAFSTTGRLSRAAWPDDPMSSPALRQAVFVTLGILVMMLTCGIGHRHLRWKGGSKRWFTQPAVILLACSVAALLAVLIPGLGSERHGARRWLHFGPEAYGIGFQPSELAKVAVIVFMAAWLPTRRRQMGTFLRGTLLPGAVLGALAALIVLEDLGTAVLIAGVGGFMILAAGGRITHAIFVAGPGLAGFIAMVFAKEYRVARITSFQDIWADPLGSGYHAIQSLIAITSGGWWGTGIGAGLQKYGYLPEARNDFVFSVVCEELGLAGGLTVLALFMCLGVLGALVMTRTPDPHGKLLALGITMMIGWQAAMNIAVVTVSVPTKGISLPFISAGGSGVIFYSVAIGILASVGRLGPPGRNTATVEREQHT
jgi:cell division protein FtsW